MKAATETTPPDRGEPRPAPHILIFSVMPGKMDAHDRRYSMRARYAIVWR